MRARAGPHSSSLSLLFSPPLSLRTDPAYVYSGNCELERKGISLQALHMEAEQREGVSDGGSEAPSSLAGAARRAGGVSADISTHLLPLSVRSSARLKIEMLSQYGARYAAPPRLQEAANALHGELRGRATCALRWRLREQVSRAVAGGSQISLRARCCLERGVS